MGLQSKPTVIQLSDQELRARLAAFEKAHQMTSGEFLLKFNTGQLGDDEDFILWAGLLSLLHRLSISTGAAG